MSPQFTCKTSASEEHQDLTIKAPPEVWYLFPNSQKKHSIRAPEEIVLWTHFGTSCVVVGHQTETFSAWIEAHVD